MHPDTILLLGQNSQVRQVYKINQHNKSPAPVAQGPLCYARVGVSGAQILGVNVRVALLEDRPAGTQPSATVAGH